MANQAPSSLFSKLVDSWSILALRCDVDETISDLLARFALEKIYSEGEEQNETYQHLVITLLTQLNTIFYIQRMSLSTVKPQTGRNIEYLASWEVIIRSVEVVLQVIGDGRHALFEAPLVMDKYLAEMLLSALRILTLHPKDPENSRSKDRRQRFARLHGWLEHVCDSYTGSHSFLLLVCKEVTDSLRKQKLDALLLPERLRDGLQDLASELYPLPDCISQESICKIAEESRSNSDWLCQFLALRDISHFVVGASIQYVVHQPQNLRMQLQTPSAKSRTAIYEALDKMRLPEDFSKKDARATFSETYRIILPDAGARMREGPAEFANRESEMEAIDALCKRIMERQYIHRISDTTMMHYISEITRNLTFLDEQIGAAQTRVFAVDCPGYHLVGELQVRTLLKFNLPFDTPEGCEIALPPDSACLQCRKRITFLRRVSLARQSRELLMLLKANADSVNSERHQSRRFQLLPSKSELTFHATYGASGNEQAAHYVEPPFQHARPIEPNASIVVQPSSISQVALNPSSPGQSPDVVDALQTGFFQLSNQTSNGTPAIPESQKVMNSRRKSNTTMESSSTTAVGDGVPRRLNRANRTGSNVSSDNMPLQRSSTLASTAPREKKSKWMTRFSSSKKEPVSTVIETSSLSSTTLESQKLEEFSLKRLVEGSKRSKQINVYLSQSSTLALFWTQSTIHVCDVGVSPPKFVKEEKTGSTCIRAAVSKSYLAYIIGTSNHKFTLRIVDLSLTAVRPVIEHRDLSLYCTCMSISPKDDYVVLGFEESAIRFFRTIPSDPPPEVRLHTRNQRTYKVETLSFSNDGDVLLGSTRSDKDGMIYIFYWPEPFSSFHELRSCQYEVPMHESEDNGVSSAIFRPGRTAAENLICITTWTQSGYPLLIQLEGGNRSEIKPDMSTRQGKLGTRIHSASFSPLGRTLALVNDKGQLYKISNLDSNPMEVRRIATSKEITKKSDPFAMAFMTLADDEAIVLAWTDFSKGIGYVKKIPMAVSDDSNPPETPGVLWVAPQELPGDSAGIFNAPVELSEDNRLRTDRNKGKAREWF